MKYSDKETLTLAIYGAIITIILGILVILFIIGLIQVVTWLFTPNVAQAHSRTPLPPQVQVVKTFYPTVTMYNSTPEQTSFRCPKCSFEYAGPVWPDQGSTFKVYNSDYCPRCVDEWLAKQGLPRLEYVRDDSHFKISSDPQ